MISIIFLLIKILIVTTSSTTLTLDTSDNDILQGIQFQEVEFTTTEMAPEPSTTSLIGTEITEKPQSLFLDLEFEVSNREDYWRTNQYECINGTYVPSKYMRRKYRLCTRIHDFAGTSECATFCKLAATLLLSEDLAPHISLYARFYQAVLPQNVSQNAVVSVNRCFERFGNNLSYFKDCERPQNFFKCVEDVTSQLIC